MPRGLSVGPPESPRRRSSVGDLFGLNRPSTPRGLQPGDLQRFDRVFEQKSLDSSRRSSRFKLSGKRPSGERVSEVSSPRDSASRRGSLDQYVYGLKPDVLPTVSQCIMRLGAINEMLAGAKGAEDGDVRFTRAAATRLIGEINDWEEVGSNIEDLYSLFDGIECAKSSIPSSVKGDRFKPSSRDTSDAFFSYDGNIGCMDKATAIAMQTLIFSVESLIEGVYDDQIPELSTFLTKLKQLHARNRDDAGEVDERRESFFHPSRRVHVSRVEAPQFNSENIPSIKILEPTEALVGKFFQGYEIISGEQIFGQTIGSGTNGKVYLCRMPPDGKQGIIKIIGVTREEAILRECNAQNQLAAQLKSTLMTDGSVGPTAPSVQAIFKDPENFRYAIAMDLAEGLPVKNKLEETNYKQYKSQLKHALTFGLHRYGNRHFDLKPDNLIWDDTNKRLTLIDFGNSFEQDSPDLQKKFKGIGSKGYMAPLISNAQDPDYCESYSSAITLAYALFGQDVIRPMLDESTQKDDVRTAREDEEELVGANTVIDGKKKTSDTMGCWLTFFQKVKEPSSSYTEFQKGEVEYLERLLKREEYINGNPIRQKLPTSVEIAAMIRAAEEDAAAGKA